MDIDLIHKELEKKDWLINDLTEVDFLLIAHVKEIVEKQLRIGGVSKSLVADIRNKLSSPKNLCAMLKDREFEPFISDDERNQMIDAEIEQTLKSIDYLSNL